MSGHKILNIASQQKLIQDLFSKELGISNILAQLLANRGIQNPQDAQAFLLTKLDNLLDPYSFADMPRAVQLIQEAAKNKQRVMIFGDYDVDGITSIALLENTLLKKGLEVKHYLPHRVKEGYGLNKNILQLARQNDIKLLITADCGINSHDEIKELRRHHIEVIVTDHHEPLNCQQHPASSIINPKVKDSRYRYRDLAGVGVVYKLCQALSHENLFEDLDLVSLGTIADVVPLTGENRIIVKEGLARLRETPRLGIKALLESSGLKERRINSTFVSYILGPRLNASGRLDSAETALNLLLSQRQAEAEELARIIETHNRQRQKIESKILEEAEALIDQEVNFKEERIIVIAKDGWHAGMLGIVASKLADKFYRPTIVISTGGHLCKGSGRSIKNFHLFEALSQCQEFLEAFGGHSHAAGLVIVKERIADFRKSINRLAYEKLAFQDLIPSLDIDMELGLSELSENLIQELERLQPFGTGNPEPLFYTRRLRLKGEPQVFSRNTLKFWVTDGKITYPAIGFGMGSQKESLLQAGEFDLTYSPQIDYWQAEASVILEVKEIFLR